jgi:hypothetical protein
MWLKDKGLSGEELNVILYLRAGSSLQKVRWLHVTHRKQLLKINLVRTMLGFVFCIALRLC